MARETKADRAWKAAFQVAAKEFLKDVGAVAAPGGFSNGFECELQTRAGRLKITLYDTWFACRFDDVEEAKRILWGSDPNRTLNPFSGKWNHHFNTRHDIDDCIRFLKFEFSKVTEAPCSPTTNSANHS